MRKPTTKQFIVYDKSIVLEHYNTNQPFFRTAKTSKRLRIAPLPHLRQNNLISLCHKITKRRSVVSTIRTPAWHKRTPRIFDYISRVQRKSSHNAEQAATFLVPRETVAKRKQTGSRLGVLTEFAFLSPAVNVLRMVRLGERYTCVVTRPAIKPLPDRMHHKWGGFMKTGWVCKVLVAVWYLSACIQARYQRLQSKFVSFLLSSYYSWFDLSAVTFDGCSNVSNLVSVFSVLLRGAKLFNVASRSPECSMMLCSFVLQI